MKRKKMKTTGNNGTVRLDGLGVSEVIQGME
jgi:hypothetical protein